MEFDKLLKEAEETIENQREYIAELEHEKQLLYGRLNMIHDLVNKKIK